MNINMQTVGIDSCVYQKSQKGSLFEALVGARAEFIELTYLGIPYRIPHTVDGKPTVRKATTGGKSSVLWWEKEKTNSLKR